MNYYDVESRIIEYVQGGSLFKIKFMNYSMGLLRFFMSIYLPWKYKCWVDNSEKNKTPPDFYSDKYGYMLEVMRFDDYELGSKSQTAIESKRIEQINNERRKNGLPLFDNKKLVLYLNPDLSDSSENNLELYFENYKRVIGNHNRKVDSYKKAHPDYKLGFLLFDESPAYGETKEKYQGVPHAGDPVGPLRYFYTPYCSLFGEELLKLDVDYVIWATPYKQINPFDNRGIIDLYLIDIKKAQTKGLKYINYNLDNVLCLEAREKEWLKKI